MEDITKRGREWDDKQCDEFAAFDASREPKEFLPQIYREASNGNQHPDARIAKTLAKCSALFVRLSADQAKAARKLEVLTIVIVVFTIIIALLTAILSYDVIQKYCHNN
jgi:hypothetical protein